MDKSTRALLCADDNSARIDALERAQRSVAMTAVGTDVSGVTTFGTFDCGCAAVIAVFDGAAATLMFDGTAAASGTSPICCTIGGRGTLALDGARANARAILIGASLIRNS